MKHPLLVAITAFFVVFSSDAPGQENEEVSFQLFYDSLAPYGDWVDVDGYGYCWQPRVKSNWRPYSDGRWAYTEAGWTWVSNEDFGWATYHYGRWTQLRNRGWVWVPGYEWAPAWVSWRTNDEYVGWAPLPPEAVWNASQGFNVTVDASYDIGPDYYNFCPIGSFGSTGLAPIIVNPVNNVTIVYNTINITYISIYQRGIYCGGPNWNYINQRCRQPIPQYRLDRRRDYDWASLRDRGGRAVIANGALSIPAPRIGRDVAQGRPRNVAYQASRNDVNRGWDNVRDSRARDQVRQRNQQQARALQNQPRPAIAALPANIGQPIAQQGDNNPSRIRGDWNNNRSDRNDGGDRGDQQANNQPQNQTPPTSSGAVTTTPSNNPPTSTSPSTSPGLGGGSVDNRTDRRDDRRDDRAQQGRQRQEEAMQQQTEEQRQRRQAMQQQQGQQQQQQRQTQQQAQQRQQSLQQQQGQQRLDQQRQEMRNRVAEQQRQQQQQQGQQQQNFQRQQQQMEQQRQQNQQQRQQQQFQQSQQPRQSQQVQQSQQPRQSQQVQQSQQPRQSQQMQPQQQGGGMGQGRRQQGQNN